MRLVSHKSLRYSRLLSNVINQYLQINYCRVDGTVISLAEGGVLLLYTYKYKYFFSISTTEKAIETVAYVFNSLSNISK